MDTPNTRSRAKRELEAGLSTPGASQDEPRVLWAHDRRWKREFVDNMKDDALPIPAPTQQPSIPRLLTNPAASNRPRKRPCNRNRSAPGGVIAAASPIDPTGSSNSAPSASAGGSNIDRLLEDYFALHRASSSMARQPAEAPATKEVEMGSSPSRRSARTATSTKSRELSPDHPIPQMSSLVLDAVDTPSKSGSGTSKPLDTTRSIPKMIRGTPQRPSHPSTTSAAAHNTRPAAPSPLHQLPLQSSQSRRLGPTLSQGESAKSLGPPPRIGLRTTHDPNKPAISHNPAKAFKSPLPGASQGVRSSPRRQPPVAMSPNTRAAGPVRAVQGLATKPQPSPLRNTRSGAGAPMVQGQGRAPAVPKQAVVPPLPKTEDKMPSSDGAGTGDESFGSFDLDFAGGGDEIAALLREVDGLAG